MFVLSLEEKLAEIIAFGEYPLAKTVLRMTPAWDLEPDWKLRRLIDRVEEDLLSARGAPWVARFIRERKVGLHAIHWAAALIKDIKVSPWKSSGWTLMGRLTEIPER